MAISVNPMTYVVHVPKADLTPVAGVLYRLNMNDLRLWLKDWEDDPNYGPYMLKTSTHNTEVLLSGITYSRTIQFLAPYTIEIEDGNYVVDCVGANHNLADVKVYNSVSIIVNNSAGLQVVTQGSGVTEQDKLDIADRVWDEVISGSSHNIATSAGRRLRALGDATAGAVSDVSPSTLSFDTDLTESRDGFYDDQYIRFTSGVLEGHVRIIRDYDGTNKTITVEEPMVEAPDNGDDFDIVPVHIHPINQIADEVWLHADAVFLSKIIKNKRVLKKTGSVWELIVYDDDDSTPILQKDLKDKDGNDISDFEAGVMASELKTSV